jgi:hypothetical protein
MAPTSRTWIPKWVSPLSGSHHSVEPPGRATTAAVDTGLHPYYQGFYVLDGTVWRALTLVSHRLWRENAGSPGVPTGLANRAHVPVAHPPSGYADEVGLADAPIWASARKHSISETDIRHALRNILAVNEHTADNDDVTLFLGSGTAGQFIEVGVLNTEDGPVIIHAMEGRLHLFGP